MRSPEVDKDVLKEFDRFLGRDFSDSFWFDPLGELVDCDKQMGEAAIGAF